MRNEQQHPSHGLAPVEPPRRRVLVMDDDPDLRALMTAALRHRSFDVLDAPDGVRGIEYLDAATRRAPWELPDLVVSDVLMPGLGGLDLLRAMRAARWTIPVLLVTAFPEPALEARARALGAACVLAKPFDMETFVATVEQEAMAIRLG
jgi:DNA-binding response OmpR family regulator